MYPNDNAANATIAVALAVVVAVVLLFMFMRGAAPAPVTPLGQPTNVNVTVPDQPRQGDTYNFPAVTPNGGSPMVGSSTGL